MVIFWVELELFCPAKNLIEHGFRPSLDSQWEISLGARLCFASGAVGEAVYFSLFNTFITIYYNQAIGHFFAGVMLDLFVRLPFEAVPGQLDEGVLIRLGITAGPVVGLSAVVSLALYSRYKLSRERHQEILETLAERRQST